MIINIAFEYKNDFCLYATLTKKLEQNENLIIFDKNGWIEGFSESLGKILKIKKKDAKLLNKIGNIHFFLPELNQFKINKDFKKNSKTDNKKFKINHQKIYFYFPIKIENFLEEISTILSTNESFLKKSKASEQNTFIESNYKNSSLDNNELFNNFHEKNVNLGLLNVYKAKISLDEQNYLLSDNESYFTSNILNLKEFNVTDLTKVMNEKE